MGSHLALQVHLKRTFVWTGAVALGWSYFVLLEMPKLQRAEVQSQVRVKPSLRAKLSNQNIAS